MFKIEDLILRVPHMFTEEECDFLVGYHIKNEESHILEQCPHAVTGEMTSSSFKCLTLISPSEEHALVHSRTREMVTKWLEHLSEFESFHLPMMSKRLNYAHKYRLLKYEVGAKIHPHTDFDDYTYGSCTFNLNDEYEGGVFRFWNGRVSIQLAKGEGMIWPADYFWVHEVTPVISGNRYSTNCFIRSVNADLFSNLQDYVYDGADFGISDTSSDIRTFGSEQYLGR